MSEERCISLIHARCIVFRMERAVCYRVRVQRRSYPYSFLMIEHQPILLLGLCTLIQLALSSEISMTTTRWSRGHHIHDQCERAERPMHVRTVPVPDWVGSAIQAWLSAASVAAEPIFRAINKGGRIATNGFSPKVIWSVVTTACRQCGLASVAPHDLRRTCARLCHNAGGEIKQIQFLLSHESVQTAERYTGCKQRL